LTDSAAKEGGEAYVATRLNRPTYVELSRVVPYPPSVTSFVYISGICWLADEKPTKSTMEVVSGQARLRATQGALDYALTMEATVFHQLQICAIRAEYKRILATL
jgi:hypothetical protein